MNNSYNIHYILYLLLFLITGGFSTQVMAQAPEISPQLIKVSKKRISRTVYEFTFKATLINHDVPIKNVTASITSNSPHTIIMSDNMVSFNDVAANETVTSVDTFTLRQDRKFPYNPADIHWDIQYEPDVPPAFEVDGQITGWAGDGDEIEVRVNEGANFGNYYSFSAKGEPKIPFTLRLNRTVIPEQGLSFTQDINGLEFQTNQYDRLRAETKEAVIGDVPGEYVVTTKATIIETGQSFSVKTKVKVYNAEEPMLHFNFDVKRLVPVGFPGELFVDVSISGSDNELHQVSSVNIQQLNSNQTFDLGFVNSESTPRVGLYALNYHGSVFVDTTQADRCYSFIVVADTSKGMAQSEPTKVCITGFPIGDNRARRNAITEPITGRIFANNILQIKFKEGTSERRIREIASAVDGEIIGQSSPFYQMELHHPVPLFQNLDEIMDQLRAFPEVELVGAEMKTGRLFSSSIANDPLFLDGLQPNLTRVRADEAWFVTRGSNSPAQQIAVIDSGISFNHEELIGRVINGFNYTGFGEGPNDTYYHGTHVAGIIGAATGNNIGMAGIAPDNLLTAVKVTEARNMWYTDLANAIKWSANLNKEGFSHDKAPIINISAGVPEHPTPDQIDACEEYKATYHRDGPCDPQVAKQKICSAVSEAVNHASLVVAAAGNDAKNEKLFPAACPGAIAVGATELYSNERWVEIGDPNASTADLLFWLFGDIYTFFGFEKVPESIGVIGGSNYGDWVSLAAPGNDVYSTVPSTKPGRRCAYGGNYDCANGTSQAAPHVSGALALVLARHSDWLKDKNSMKKAKNRLLNTAKPLPNADLGKGQLNIFDAVFNGDFELPDDSGKKPNPIRLAEWEHKETSDAFLHCKAVSFFGNITPPKGEKMLSCGTQGVYEFNTSIPSAGSYVKNRINLPEGVTHLPLSFKWKVASVDLSLSRQTVLWDDRMTFRLRRVDDPSKEVILFDTSLNHIMNNGRHLSASSIYPFVETDWILDSYAHPIPYGAGEYELIIGIADRYDNVGDTYIFVDDLQFRLR